MTFLMGVFVNAPIPTVATAAQKPILASIRTKSSAEKLMCMPKNSCPGNSLLASAKVGPQTRIIPRFVNTPGTGRFAHVTAGVRRDYLPPETLPCRVVCQVRDRRSVSDFASTKGQEKGSAQPDYCGRPIRRIMSLNRGSDRIESQWGFGSRQKVTESAARA